MARSLKKIVADQPKEQLQLMLKYHPMRLFVYLGLVGISSAFLFLSISYFLTTFGTNFNHFRLPLLFHANTIIILASSYTIMQTRKAIMADDWQGYTNGLLITLGLGVAFVVFQLMGWQELVKGGINFTNNIAGTYLYVISGLHLIHLLTGILLLGYFLLRALEAKNDAVKTLLFESDPFCKMKVDVLCTYWHFVDGLWVYLYLFFVVNIYVFTKGNFHSIF